MITHLAKATVSGKTSWDGEHTIYAHSAEGTARYPGVRIFQFHSSTGDPTVIPNHLWGTHLDYYWGGIYVHSKEGAHVQIPGLRFEEFCSKLETPSRFIDAVMHRLGQDNSLVSCVEIKKGDNGLILYTIHPLFSATRRFRMEGSSHIASLHDQVSTLGRTVERQQSTIDLLTRELVKWTASVKSCDASSPSSGDIATG